MEEFDLYDLYRQKTGRTLERGQIVPDGYANVLIHICLFNEDHQLLIQQRQPWKHSWKNLWDVSVGGHVEKGETSQQAAERELKEELGLTVDFTGKAPNLSLYTPNNFDDWYLVRTGAKVSDLVLQQEEVQDARFASLSDVLDLIHHQQFVPYMDGLMMLVFSMIEHGGHDLVSRDWTSGLDPRSSE